MSVLSIISVLGPKVPEYSGSEAEVLMSGEEVECNEQDDEHDDAYRNNTGCIYDYIHVREHIT